MPAKDGPILFGYCLDILLYGILTVQAYIYYLSFPGDRRLTKATVAFVYAVGTIQTAFALHDFYSIFCLPAHDEVSSPISAQDDLHRFGFMWITIPLSGTLVAAVSQLFYAQRIHILSGKKKIPGIVVALALVQFGFGIYTTFASYGNWTADTSFAHDLGLSIDFIGWMMSGVLCDLVITIYMFRFLSRRLQQPQVYRPTRVSLIRIKRITLESGLITTGVATTYMLSAIPILFTSSVGFIIPGLALSKVYGNSILALLNSRLRIPGGRKEIDSVCLVDNLAIEERQA